MRNRVWDLFLNIMDLTIQEAVLESKRCLNCKAPQCVKGCPVSNEIPRWVHALSMGNFGEAMDIINIHSNLPAVCSRVCAHERQCEGHCVLGKKGDPLRIGALERFISQFDADINLSRETIPCKDKGCVAVIGSGPAGLTVAGVLARRGYNVEIFEREPQPGGMLMFGIPEYRLPKEVVQNEIEKIAHLGVKINCDVTVGVDMTVDDMFDDGYDAIFIGTGTAKPRRLDFPGSNLPAIGQAIFFLSRFQFYLSGYIIRDEMIVKEGSRVVIVGCGNTAMDAARTALRVGASKVTVMYRKTIDEMSALKSEYNDAVEEGVDFMWNTNITAVNSSNGRTIDNIDILVDGKPEQFEADVILFAVGSVPASRIVSTTDGIEVDDKGFILIRENPYGMTTRKGVFAAGDVTKQPATVVHAMRDAQMVAESICQYVDAVNLLREIDRPGSNLKTI